MLVNGKKNGNLCPWRPFYIRLGLAWLNKSMSLYCPCICPVHTTCMESLYSNYLFRSNVIIVTFITVSRSPNLLVPFSLLKQPRGKNTFINTYIVMNSYPYCSWKIVFIIKVVYVRHLAFFRPKFLKRTQEEQRRAAGGRLWLEVQTPCPFTYHRWQKKVPLSYTFNWKMDTYFRAQHSRIA